MPAAAAIPGLIGIGTSIFGGINQSRAASSAANTMASAANAAANDVTNVAGQQANLVNQAGQAAAGNMNAIGGQVSGNTLAATQAGQAGIGNALEYFNPYSQAGQSALARLQAGLADGGEFSQRFSGGVGDFLNDAGLQFRIQQGTRALENSATARGMLGGNTARAITDYAQGAASEEYGKAFDRNLASFNTNRRAALDPLQAMIGAGMDADRSRLGGATNSAQLGLQGTMGAGNQSLDAARAANTFAFGGAQSGADMTLRGNMAANNYRTDAASALAGGSVGRANALSGALTGVGQGAAQIDWRDLFRR